MSAPAHTALSVQQFFDPCPTLPIFVSPDEKVFKRKCFASVEKVKQKSPAETLKGIKIDTFKNYLEQCKKCLNRCIASNGEYFEDEV